MRFTLTDTMCVHHADFDLNKITILVGDNGCGKTTCTALLGNLLTAVCTIHATAPWKPTMQCTLTDSTGKVIVSETELNPCTEITSVIDPPILAGKLPPTPMQWNSLNKRIETLLGGKFVCEPGISQSQTPCSIQRYDGTFIKPLFFSRFDNILYLLTHCIKHNLFVKDAMWLVDTPDVGLSPSNCVELANLLIQIQRTSQVRIFLTCCTMDLVYAMRTLGKTDVNVYIAQPSENGTTYDYTLVRTQKQLTDYAKTGSTVLQAKNISTAD